MQLKRSILFLGQAILLHGLIIFYGFTVSPESEGVESDDTMTTYSVDSIVATEDGVASAAHEATQSDEPALPAQPERAINPGELKFDSLRTVGDKVIADLANGWTAETTLDPWLNGIAHRYLERGRVPYGAAVILDVKSGDILAMADRFDEEHPVSQGIEVKGPSSLALMRTAPAASVYKIVTSAALLDKGIQVNQTYPYSYAKRRVESKHLDKPGPNWDRAHLADALADSNNGFFARVSDTELSWDEMRAASHRFGFNQVIPFDILTDASVAKTPRNRLERARMAAGFKHTELTPLHAALIVGAVAKDGELSAPRFVSRLHGPEGQTIDAPSRGPINRAMKIETARSLRKVMAKTTKTGTARRAWAKWPSSAPKVSVGGKTGTLCRREPYTCYTWFVGYAPVDNPQVAIAVMVANGEKWWQRAVDISRDILAAHFRREAKRHFGQ